MRLERCGVDTRFGQGVPDPAAQRLGRYCFVRSRVANEELFLCSTEVRGEREVLPKSAYETQPGVVETTKCQRARVERRSCCFREGTDVDGAHVVLPADALTVD